MYDAPMYVSDGATVIFSLMISFLYGKFARRENCDDGAKSDMGGILFVEEE